MKLRTHTFLKYKTPKVLSLAILGVFLGFLFAAGISRTKATNAFAADSNENSKVSHFVTFHEGSSSLTIKTNAKTVEEAISRAKIDLDNNDRTEPERLEEIDVESGKNFDVHIFRARPVVMIDGAKKKYLMTATYDLKSLATQAGFTVYQGDKIEPKTQKNIAEVGLAETYEIKRGDSNDSNGVAKKALSREKILNIKEVKEEKVPEFVANPDSATCEAWIRAAGVAESEVDVAYWIIFKESKCRYNATNRYSGAYGIPQALPGRKMASVGADWETNPITQIKWMTNYVNGRYGGWWGAKSWWDTHNWY
jgi:hypothetical protein